MFSGKPSMPSFGPRKRSHSQTPPPVPPMPPKRSTKRRKLQNSIPRSAPKLFRLALPAGVRHVTMVKMDEDEGNAMVAQHVRLGCAPSKVPKSMAFSQPVPGQPTAAFIASRNDDVALAEESE
ncbi:hypothetical protein AAVH_25240 [Aphelenchoides avenae]|nr:hypothetical protein AAVH_25240 [Aphelenchus avenae]